MNLVIMSVLFSLLGAGEPAPLISSCQARGDQARELWTRGELSEAADLYERILADLAAGMAELPSSERINVAVGGRVFGGYSTFELKHQIIPRLRFEAGAKRDPVLAAWSQALALPDPRTRTETLLALARALLAREQPADAGLVLQDAVTAARLITKETGREIVLSSIGRSLAEAGLGEQALAVARDMKKPDLIFAEVAGRTAEAGDLESAKKIAERSLAPMFRARVEGGLVSGFISRGELSQAEDLARGIQDSNWQLSAFKALAREYGHRGDAAQIRSLARWVENNPLKSQGMVLGQDEGAEPRDRILASGARACAEDGRGDLALNLMEDLRDPGMKALVLSWLAKAQSPTAGNGEAELYLGQAAAQAALVSRVPTQALIMLRLSTAARDLGFRTLADQYLTKSWDLVKDLKKGGLLDPRAGILEAMAELGRCEEAAAAAETIPAGFWKDTALAKVIGGCARGANPDQALAMLPILMNDNQAAAALQAVILALADRGDFGRAMGLLPDIRIPGARIETLARLGLIYREQGSPYPEAMVRMIAALPRN